MEKTVQTKTKVLCWDKRWQENLQKGETTPVIIQIGQWKNLLSFLRFYGVKRMDYI